MVKTIILGNSGSGKSTLAKHLAQQQGAFHLDLDTLAWQNCTPPVRVPQEQAAESIEVVLAEHASWVVEGCYADLIASVIDAADNMIFLNLPVALCVENAKQRPWEPHKYPSKAAQDANLAMLIDWIGQYTVREDDFSHAAHLRLYEQFAGDKVIYQSNATLPFTDSPQ